MLGSSGWFGMSSVVLEEKREDEAWWFSKIDYVPLNVPSCRRLQMAGLIIYNTLTINCIAAAVLLGYFGFWPFLVVYFTFVYFDRQYEDGGRPSVWAKQWALWKLVASYFPMRMVRETRLDPNGKYMFGYHPHGIIANGAILGFTTDALGLSDLFPGISIHMLTINALFLIPFYRDIAMFFGSCSASKKSINNIYKRGNSCLIVTGGAEEALLTSPGKADLIIKRRLGFVKIAIQNGASLVPVYSFGENEIFNVFVPHPKSFLYKFQRKIKDFTGFTLPLFYGRSIFTYNCGLLPKRGPITIIVGSPIPTEMDPNPSKEKVIQVHQQYLDALKDLYDRNKSTYSRTKNIPEINFL